MKTSIHEEQVVGVYYFQVGGARSNFQGGLLEPRTEIRAIERLQRNSGEWCGFNDAESRQQRRSCRGIVERGKGTGMHDENKSDVTSSCFVRKLMRVFPLHHILGFPTREHLNVWLGSGSNLTTRTNDLFLYCVLPH
jgi:hypothetical protein